MKQRLKTQITQRVGDPEKQARVGRPRAFNRALALERAKRLFWDKGYAGTQVTDLTSELGINPPSLYAAFGDKRTLFHETVALYVQEDMAAFRKSLAKPDIFDAIRSCLVTSANLCAGAKNPKGCLLVTGAMNYAPEDRSHMEEISRIRSSPGNHLQARLKKAAEDGQLNRDTDVESLALFFLAFINGMAVRAKDGAPANALIETVDLAMLALGTLK